MMRTDFHLPCFSAALAGYVEETRGNDADKNSLCRPISLSNTMPEWAAMNATMAQAEAAFRSQPDAVAWASGVSHDPAHVPPGYPDSTALNAVAAPR